MNECKVCRVPINVEDKYKKKNSKRRVSLPMVYWKKKKKQIQRATRKMMLLAIEITLAIVPAWLISLWAIPAAYNHRGYDAVGGEWILIIVTFGFSFNFISKRMDRMIRKERRKRRYC